jgi:hypothetical protein
MDNAEFVRLLKEELESKSFKYKQLENENESLKKSLEVKVWICKYLILYFYKLSTVKICCYEYYVGFEVLTVVVMKGTIFWDIMLCSALKVNRRFGGTYCLDLQGRRISRARNQKQSSTCHLLSHWFLAWLIL